MPKYLVDTDIVIDDLRKRRSLDQLFEQYFPDDLAPDLYMSLVSLLELLMAEDANHPDKRQIIIDLTDKLTPVSIDNHIVKAAEIIRKRRIKQEQTRYRFIPDSIIAATAIENSLILVSRNRRDFEWLDEIDARFVD